MKSLLIYLAVINVVTFFMYGIDKIKAKRNKWRIRETALLGLAVLGGSVGAWIGMMVWRHKTMHKKFRYGIPLILIAQIALLFLFLHRTAWSSTRQEIAVEQSDISAIADKVWAFSQNHPNGFTLNVRTMTEPEEGIAVSYAETQHSHSRSELERVVRHALLNEGYVGGWYNSEDSLYYFDSSRLFPESALDEAIEFGRENGQRTVFILSSSTEINITKDKITAEMAFEGVSNYCHSTYDWSVAEDNPSIMYVEMGVETDSAYQVVFRSYTGAFVNFYVDKTSGQTRIEEYVPALDIKEEAGTIDLFDYLSLDAPRATGGSICP